MTASALQRIEAHYARLRDLEHARSLLGWDQEVLMPSGAAELRASTLSGLAATIHERTTDPDYLALLERAWKGAAKLKPRERRTVELARREARRAAALTSDIAAELSECESRGLEAWRRARAEDDFERFRPHLEKMLRLKREVARRTAAGRRPYDALLDEYEPDATIERIDPLLDELVRVTVPLLQHVQATPRHVQATPRDVRATPRARRPRPLEGRFPVDAQRAFAGQVVAAMGIDPDRSRLDVSTHPFCGGVGPFDVRMTGRFAERDPWGFLAVVHEAGHGLYEQGLDPRRARSALGGAVSMAIHESQSRLWENGIARSRPFWKHWLPKLRRAFPDALRGATLDSVWRSANVIEPTPIRVEADELTYNLHVVLRYRIERDLVEGGLAVRDLPHRWNAETEALLGFTPRSDAEGCLQDIHWAMGAFGYFPTYSLGNLYAAQLLEAAERALPELWSDVARGDLLPLRDWLRETIHRHDRVFAAEPLARRATGEPLGVAALERHLRSKVTELYGAPPEDDAPERPRRRAASAAARRRR